MATTRLEKPAFYETAPVHFHTSRVIPASPDEVFAALADTPNWPKWFPSLTAAKWQTEPPHGVGSRRCVNVGPVRVDEEFIVWEPGRRWGFTFVATTIPLVRAGAELVELEPEGDGTRVTYNMHVEPLPGLGGLTKLLRAGIEKGLADGLKGLERHLAA